MIPKRSDDVPKTADAQIQDDNEDMSVTLPVDTDDNDEPNADASGDSDDEKPDENDAPDDWIEGEL